MHAFCFNAQYRLFVEGERRRGGGVIEDFNLQMEDLSERGGGLIRAFTVSMKHFSHY